MPISRVWEQVMERMRPIEAGVPELWQFVQQLIEECAAVGYFKTTLLEESRQ
jgi:hypothetical protein